MNTDKKDS